jgi:hypothetical protein
MNARAAGENVQMRRGRVGENESRQCIITQLINVCLPLFDADFTAKALSTSISISEPGLCAEHSGRSFKVTTTRRRKKTRKKNTRASAIYLIAPVSVYVDSWQVLMRVAPRVMEPLYCYYALWRRLCAFAGGRASESV